jgi:hypothetical protein
MIARRFLPRDTQELVLWYERFISPLALIGGFIADNLILLRRVDLWTTDALLGFYLVASGAGILFLNAADSGRVKSERLQRLVPFVPIVIQFSIGGLFSGYLSLYSRSAAFAGSWVFVIVVALLLLSNERFLRFYRRLVFQVSLYFVVLYSFFIFVLPVIFKRIGADMFLLAGVVSLGVTILFSLLITLVAPERMRAARVNIIATVAALGLFFNILYFANLIPPLPLALKAGGLYHNVSHETDGTYSLVGETVPWYEAFLRYNIVFHKLPGESAYVFTAIFAPTGLTTTIIHEWQWLDPTTDAWTTTADIPFEITGGRDGGYRGWSGKYDPAAGRWRVNVLTPSGQLITRISFTVVDATTSPTVESSSL